MGLEIAAAVTGWWIAIVTAPAVRLAQLLSPDPTPPRPSSVDWVVEDDSPAR